MGEDHSIDVVIVVALTHAARYRVRSTRNIDFVEQHVSLDLVELALERMTDFAEFERLATEVMYLDGWHDIKPLGGTSDLGQDAVSEQFFRQASVERTVFQYTLQEHLPGKVTDTIKKLRDNKSSSLN